ncbi:MAG: glycosyltransferase [Candidatus Shapirobacteria bacterium]
MKNRKIAMVYDWVNQWGGAERVVKAVGDIFPESDLFTGVYDQKKASWAEKSFKNIYPSFLNFLPWAKDRYRSYVFLFPRAFHGLNFKNYDLVISITSYPGKFIFVQPPTCHLCYCLTPPRFLWQKNLLSLEKQKLFPLWFGLRVRDVLAANNIKHWLTISKNSQRRIRKFYRKEAKVVYPGIDLNQFKPCLGKRENYYLAVSRLVSYKKIDLAISVFNKLGWKLKIIGIGREYEKLKKMAKGNIEFLGQVSDNDLVFHYQRARGVIFPQEEDFGLVPLEAQACGTPVLAFGRGGALETVIPGKTGEFFSVQNEESLLNCLKYFVKKNYSPKKCYQNANQFSLSEFKINFKKEIESMLSKKSR